MELMKECIWNKFKKINILSSNKYSSYYKVKNIKTGNYFGVKEINKHKFKQFYNYDISINKTNIKYLENEIKFENYYYETEEYLYLIMELGICNLKEYLNIRKDKLSIEEIKDILFQLNKYLKQNKCLKLSHILLSSNNLNSLEIKIVNYSKIINKKEESFKIYNLGKLIYYIIFRKYPNDTLLKVKNENLNNLLNEMLKNENYSWEKYFIHPFFNEEKEKKYKNNFNYLCEKHSLIFNSYCDTCKYNICSSCLNQHHSHKIISFEYIEFNQLELNQIQKSIEKFEVYINKFKNYLEKINKKDYLIYDINNNYKLDYIKQLNYLSDFISIHNSINLFNINECIICEYDIKKGKDDKDDYLNQRIINSFEEVERNKSWIKGTNNEDEIKGNCELYLNNYTIDFSYK